ncbi:hypothetical protein [Vibrio vulnificus]|uniref:hypothetical protein n=1 Tax=Vibrio vulnificus TaxID=672 RepID=UPI0005FB3755|nr:hypothetical protein [Vibrio vulnificus]EIV8467033.1 hypothetical protein [Vibrio vulnificus]
MMDEQEMQPEMISAEERAFIGALEDEFEPSESAELSGAPALESAKMTALFSLNMTEGLLKQFGHGDFSFDESQKEQTASAIAPALAKYGGELPAWLEPYKEEVFALIAIGTLGFTSYAQIKALKALDVAQKEAVSDAAD